MKIGKVSPVSSKTSIAPLAVPYRTGDVVVVQLQTVAGSSGEVELKFPGDEVLSAVLKGGTSLNKGDFVRIKVLGNTENKIYAEILEANKDLKVSSNNIAFLLSRINVATSKENQSIAMQILRNNMELTKGNIEKIKSYIENFPEFSLEKIVFMMKHDMPFSKEYETVLDAMARHDSFLGKNLLSLIGEILAGHDENNKLKKLLKKFFISPGSPDFKPEDLSSKSTLDKLARLFSYLQSNYKGHKNIDDLLGTYIKSLQTREEIANKLQHYMAFLQIPVNINGNYDEAEFYSAPGQGKFNKSVFLRIPTSNLGVLGFFIIINHERQIELHISAQQTSYIKHIKKSIMRLYRLLGDVGYKLVTVTYNKIPADISLYNFTQYSKLLGEKIKFDERM
ncbi:MAG: hypothetical protein PHF89_00765 [Eubacteriales bacterium]|jgi:hypothetical protein|nr:hypothetical protein [Eubacteriales bacterium]